MSALSSIIRLSSCRESVVPFAAAEVKRLGIGFVRDEVAVRKRLTSAQQQDRQEKYAAQRASEAVARLRSLG